MIKKISYATMLILFTAMVSLSGSAANAKNPTVYAQTVSASQFVDQAFNSRAVNFRLSLNNLLKEHTVLAGTMLTSLYKGEDTTRLEQLMNDNENMLADGIQNISGGNARDQFVQLWTAHM